MDEAPYRESSKERYLMGHKEISIVKMTGEKASFNSSKLRLSLKRSEASDMIISQIIAEVEGMLYDGITTKGIYKTACSFIQKLTPHSRTVQAKKSYSRTRANRLSLREIRRRNSC